MTGRRLSVSVPLFMLVLLMGAQVAQPSPVFSQVSPGQIPWWNSSYQDRQAVSVTNGGAQPFVNQSVIVPINFTGAFVQDALASVRLVDSAGNETQSVLVGSQYSGLFLRSTYLVFSTSLAAGATSVYYLYFGSSFQSVPSYRTAQPVGSIASGFTTASLQVQSVASNQIQLGFGTVDTEQTMSKVGYSLGGKQDYGPSGIATDPFTDDTGLIASGQIDGPSTVAYQSMQAGAIQLTRILILSPTGALTVDAVSSDSNSTLADVSLTTFVGLEGLSTLGPASSRYDAGAALLITQNTDGNFIVSQTPGPGSFTLGTTAEVESQALRGNFDGVSSYTRAGAAGFTWGLGVLPPSASVLVSSGWGVSVASQAATAVPSGPVSAVLGQVEVRNSATPTAVSLWSAVAALTDVSIPSEGLVIPFGIGGGSLDPGASTVAGTFAYNFPPAPAQGPDYWASVTSTTGNASALAARQYYDFSTRQTISRLLTYIPDATSQASSSLASVGGFVLGGATDSLKVRYKASYGVVSGDLTAQSFFVAADFDPTLTGNYSESIFAPLSGSSTVLPSGCETAGSQGASIISTTASGSLIGDGTWRTLSIGLPSSLPSTGFNVRLRLCVATAPGFVGLMDLNVASAGIVHRGSVSNILQETFSQTTPELTLGYGPQAQGISGVGVTANLSVSLVFQTKATVGWADGSDFGGLVAPSPAFAQNDSALKQTSLVPPRLDGILVSSGLAQSAETGSIGGASVPASRGPGVILLNGGGSSGSSTQPFVVGFGSQSLIIQVVDQDQSGVAGVQVVPSANGVSLPLSLATNSTGYVRAQLVPWTYNLNATFQGLYVGSASIEVGSQPSVSISANVYELTLLIKDSRGGNMVGFPVTVNINNSTFTGTTNSKGEYNFEAVANSIYNLTIGTGSEAYFSGQVAATANNAVIQVTTSFLPPSVQLEVAVILAAIPVAIVAAYYAYRRLGASR